MVFDDDEEGLSSADIDSSCETIPFDFSSHEEVIAAEMEEEDEVVASGGMLTVLSAQKVALAHGALLPHMRDAASCTFGELSIILILAAISEEEIGGQKDAEIPLQLVELLAPLSSLILGNHPTCVSTLHQPSSPPPASQSVERKGVTFSNSDGSCVSPPNDRRPTSWVSTLAEANRIFGLVQGLQNISLSGFSARVAVATRHLSQPDFAASAITLMEELSIFPCATNYDKRRNIESLQRITSLINNELVVAAGAGGCACSTTSVIRQRTSWMLSSVIRSTLRWLFDLPPPCISAPGAAGYIIIPFVRNFKPSCVTLCARESFHTEVETSSSCSSMVSRTPRGTTSAVEKRKRKKESEVDHTNVSMMDMPISSLFLFALRQIHSALTGAKTRGFENIDDLVDEALREDANSSINVADVVQLTLAAEAGRQFLKETLSLPTLESARVPGREASVWETLQECSSMLSGMCEDDQHLCVFQNGLAGLRSWLDKELVTSTNLTKCSTKHSQLLVQKTSNRKRHEASESPFAQSDLILNFPSLAYTDFGSENGQGNA